MKCHSDQLTVGKLCHLLSKQPPENRVVFDFCYFCPDLKSICSYRGFYEDLAIGYDEPSFGDGPTVDTLRKKLEELLGTTMTGYKGGDYTIKDDTAVWVANWSNCGSTAVVNVEEVDSETVIVTRKISFM